LLDAARACRLLDDDGEIQTRRTIKSGLDDGARKPHPDLTENGDTSSATIETPQYPPCALTDVHRIFKKWFGEDYDTDVIDAVLATAAAELLDGDPLWLLVISGPGNTKTETVQSLAGAGAHVTSTISSEGALLSATPTKSRAKNATGGLLKKIGNRGVLVVKDVTSILSADRKSRPQAP